jgi:hypothetical protein
MHIVSYLLLLETHHRTGLCVNQIEQDMAKARELQDAELVDMTTFHTFFVSYGIGSLNI